MTDGEDTDGKVLAVINGKMNLQPPLHIGQIERSHRVGRKTTDSQHDERGPPRPWPIIVRLCSERVRDVVFRPDALTTQSHDDRPRSWLFIQEDLMILILPVVFLEASPKKGHFQDGVQDDCWDLIL